MYAPGVCVGKESPSSRPDLAELVPLGTNGNKLDTFRLLGDNGGRLSKSARSRLVTSTSRTSNTYIGYVMAAKKAQTAAEKILASENGLAMVEALLAQVAAAGKGAPTAPKEHVLSTYENQGATESVVVPRALEADEQACYDLHMVHGTNNAWCRNGLQATRIMRFEIRSSSGRTVIYERTAMGRFFKNMSK